ncbi:MAG: substrate-binding domain-containing protein [Mycobacterium sp.]
MKLKSSRSTARKLLALSASVVVLAACSSTGGRSESDGAAASTPRMTVAMVTHAPPGDAFWDLIRKGAQAAADKDNIELRYSSDPQAPNQANLIQSAIDSGVDGIAVTFAKPEAMAPAVKAAVAADIPIVAFNSGIGNWQDLDALAYFGQDERLAGKTAGQRFSDEGVKHVLCVIHEQGTVGLEERCAGVKEGFAGTTEVVNVNGTDMPSVQATVTAKLQQDPSIDAVITLGAAYAVTVADSLKTAGSSARIATFDTDGALVDAIKDGTVEFAVDQQPYLQGYLAIDALWLYRNNRNIIGGGLPVLTGPSFVDKSNVDSIAELAQAGTR